MTGIDRKQIFATAHRAAKNLSHYTGQPYAVVFRDALKRNWSLAKFNAARRAPVAKVHPAAPVKLTPAGTAKVAALREQIMAAEMHMEWEAFKVYKFYKNREIEAVQKEFAL